MTNILKENINEIAKLCKLYNVESLFAFGSVMTPRFHTDSDIDLLISFKPTDDHGQYADNYFALIDKFERLFNRNVDLITNKSLSNPYLIESINKTKTQLYGN